MNADTGQKTLELEVEGLCCTECAVSVEKTLTHRDGVDQVKILSSAEKVRLSYDESKTSKEELANSIAALGYKVRYKGQGAATMPTVGQSRVSREAVRFGLVALVALIAMLEIGGEYLGWFEKAQERIPVPVLLATIAIGGYHIFRRAVLGALGKQINVDSMMSVGILSAAAIGQYTSAMLIVFFMGIAHFLEEFTTRKSRKAIQALVKLSPKTARVKLNGQEREIAVEALRVGDIVAVRPGEYIPVDGIVITGASSVNQASITGESMPVAKQAGSEVFAATMNERGYLEVKVSRIGADTTFGKIIKLVEEAEAVKAPVQKFADRFTTYFLPVAIGVAVLAYLTSGEITYAIAVLVAACPCAVGLATPLSVIASVGSGANRGLLIKGGLYLERLAKVDCVVMDKTGTVTLGKPQVTDVVSLNGLPAEVLLKHAASLEKNSEHPIASAILSYARARNVLAPDAEHFEYTVGQGLRGIVEGKAVVLGNVRLLENLRISLSPHAESVISALGNDGKTALLLAINGVAEGIVGIADVMREEVPAAIEALRRLGIKRLMLLTGDNERVATAIAGKLGITDYRSGLLPEDKIEIVKTLQRAGLTVAMIGDGVNDAPALAQADVGIAMGVVGSDVALEAAHVALMRDDWSQIPQAIQVGRRTYRVIRQNIFLGITWDIVTMGLASVGVIGPVLAAATEVVPDVFVSLNSARLLKAPKRLFSRTAAADGSQAAGLVTGART